jgi:phenylacetaldehyde dehydrogenase
MAESLTTGVVIRQSRALSHLVPLAFRQAARQMQQGGRMIALSDNVRLGRIPWGPVVIMSPWSSSAASAAQKVASALAAGCPVILKPSEWSPHSCGILAEAITSAGLPPGTFQLVNGGPQVSANLVRDPRIRAVTFGGSLEDGRMIAQLCAESLKPVQLELDGVNPFIVMEDADVEHAAEGIITALTTMNGQWNRGLGRLLIHAKKYHPLLNYLLDQLETITIGDSMSPDSELGPLIHSGHLQHVQDVVSKQMTCGAVVNEARPMEDLSGYFMPPSLITNCPSEYSLEPILGPVATVQFYKTDDEAIALANEPDSAAVAYIFGDDEKQAFGLAQRIQASSVSINAVSLLGLHPQVPQSGWGHSGLGESGIAESFRFFTGTRAIGIAGS